MKARRKLSIRTWLVGGIIVLVVASYASVAGLVGFTLLFEPPQPKDQPRDTAAMEQVYQQVESASDRWRDSAWQQAIAPQLDALQLRIQITDLAKQPVFMYPPGKDLLQINRGVFYSTVSSFGSRLRQAAVYQGAQLAGEITWYQRYEEADPSHAAFDRWQNSFMNISWPLAVVGVVMLGVWLVSRMILNPLKALSEAAGKINRGELDFTVPESPIREVNEFARAFDQMRAGLKESLGRQAAMEQERRMFIAGVAHDLRTPLTSIRGYLEGLHDGVANTPEKMSRYVGVALDKTATLERLIEGFFAYSRVELLEQPPQREPVDLGALLAGAVAAAGPRAQGRSLSLSLDEGPEPCTVNADAAMLTRVVDNLLENAIRYTPEGGAITVGWRSGIDHARFWVQDTGPGIPPDDLGRVFQPLYRGDKARGSRTGGSGLGLAIARRLVEAHGGTISVENDGGARFTVTLPIEKGRGA